MSAYQSIDTTVVILSAGHGTRMLPLTEHTPKPLLKVGDLSLIEHHLVRLKEHNFFHIVVNTAYLGEQIRKQLGDGSSYGLKISYSDEADTGALETAGGLKAALGLINSDPFLVINADIWTDYSFTPLLEQALDTEARLVMVKNPEHNLDGDFGLSSSNKKGFGLLNTTSKNRYTFSGIGLYKKCIFEQIDKGKQALGPLLKHLITQEKVQAQVYNGQWKDIGTPERLEQIRQLNQF